MIEMLIVLLVFFLPHLTEILNGVTQGITTRNWRHKLYQIDQAAPVQNTWYTVCEDINLFISSIALYVMTTGETLECQITIDGETWGTTTQAAVAGTVYGINLQRLGNVQYLAYDTGEYNVDRQAGTYALSVKIEVRKTTAAGAGQLRSTVIGAKLE